MGLNRTAKGIVLVPSLLLGGAFIAAAVWGEASGSNRNLALSIGALLMGAGLLAQLFPEASPENPEAISRSGEAPPDRALESKR
jgi:hypothetical protein